MSTTTKTHHSNVTLYSAGNCRFGYPAGYEITSEDARRSYLAEFRECGSIGGAFLADPDDYPEDGDEDICSAGPSVDEIDWTGFEA